MILNFVPSFKRTVSHLFKKFNLFPLRDRIALQGIISDEAERNAASYGVAQIEVTTFTVSGSFSIVLLGEKIAEVCLGSKMRFPF